MPSPLSDHSSRTTLGIFLMTAAMLSVPMVDGLAKHLTATYSPLFIGWARYAVACAFVLPFAAAMHGPRLFPSRYHVPHVLRTIFLIAAMTLYYLAIVSIPLATAVSAFFVGPIIAVALSALILKERVTLRKGLSLLLGFAGAIVILRPGGSVDPGIWLAFGSGICFAFYVITTRQASQSSDPVRTLAFQCVVGTLLLTPQAVMTWSTPAWGDLIFFVLMGLISAGSHALSITAFRFADASTLSPLVYLELIATALIGYFAFSEVPGLPTIIGAALIVSAGLILIPRQGRRYAQAA